MIKTVPTRGEAQSPIAGRRAPIAGSCLGGLFAMGAYFVLLRGERLREILSLPADMVPGPGFPSWMLEYLALLCALILTTGGLLFMAGFTARKGRPIARALILWGAIGAFVFTGLHSWFLFFYERAFADGGLVWGTIHLLTLTRMDTTATEAGVVGYRIGQVFGIAVWVGCASYLLVIASGLRKSTVSTPPCAKIR